MKKTYYIFRHGETFATKGKKWYWLKLFSAPILDEGKPSITCLAKYLKEVSSDYNTSSPFLRCIQTAQIVSEITGKKFIYDARIKEYTFEFPWSFKKRIENFVNEMESSKHRVIIICTHAVVIEFLIQYLVNGHISLTKRLKAPLPGILTIIKNQKIQEINFNTEV